MSREKAKHLLIGVSSKKIDKSVIDHIKYVQNDLIINKS